jgi:GlpG protein
MRVIGTLSHENDARRLAHYLTSQGIANSCDVSFDAASGGMSYQLWIHEEDKMGAAASAFKEFQKNGRDSKFDAPIPEPAAIESEEAPPPEPHHYKTYLTLFILALCSFFFFINTLQEIPLKKERLELTPLQTLFMYDLPPENGPHWSGIYDFVVHKIKGESTAPGEGPLFIKIRQGEVWRLITPVLLHHDLLHILFNMLWLWYLGRPIEQRIGPLRTLTLSLIAGVGSNTVQYLMSGPFFIGYSGIVTALAGFTWMRERIAPWEGYPLNKATILFLLFFIGAIFALQVVAFCIQIFSTYNFAPNIANSAHIAGALIGAFLARFKFFAQRVKT